MKEADFYFDVDFKASKLRTSDFFSERRISSVPRLGGVKRGVPLFGHPIQRKVWVAQESVSVSIWVECREMLSHAGASK